MNWYDAEECCETNSMTMPTLKEMCSSWEGNDGEGKCPELTENGTINVWSSTLYDSKSMFIVSLYIAGNVESRDQRDDSLLRAFSH